MTAKLIGKSQLSNWSAKFAHSAAGLKVKLTLAIWKVRFQPVKRACFIVAINKLLKFIELGIGHLFGQLHTDTHFERFINVCQYFLFFFWRQAAKAELCK